MKRKVAIGSVVIALLVAAILFVHPVKVLCIDSYKWQIFVNLTHTDVESFTPMSGGWRAYLDEENYIWFSDGEYQYEKEGLPFGIKWTMPWQKPILKMGVS